MVVVVVVGEKQGEKEGGGRCSFIWSGIWTSELHMIVYMGPYELFIWS